MYRFAKEISLDQVILTQVLNQSEFEESYLLCAQRHLEKETSAVFLVWYKELEKNDYLGSLKSLHDFLGRIRSIYSNCLIVFEKSVDSISSPEVEDIIKGAIEMLKNGLHDMPQENENLVEREDHQQLTVAMAEMQKSLVPLIYAKLKECNASDFIKFGSNHIFSKLIELLNERNVESVKKHQLDILIQLNQLEIRPELKRYCKAIDAIIRAIVPLQSINIEIVVEKVVVEKDIQTLTNVLRIIQDIYLKTISEQENFQKVLQNLEISEASSAKMFQVLMDEVAFVKDVEDSEELRESLQIYLNNKQEITDKLYAQLNDEISKAYMFTARDLRNQSKEIQLLSCQIIEAIKLTCSELSQLSFDEVSGNAHELLKRILESIELKHESLKDKNFEYTIQKRDLYILQNKQLFDFKENFLDNFEDNFEKMLLDSTRHLLVTQEDFNKLVNRLEDQCLKMDMEFLKRDLLFEVVTFEEIINHSLPKLQNYQEDAVLAACDQLNELNTKIQKVIHQAGIIPITPHSHEKFNGKEHEVIIVEEQFGFSKGEIIHGQTKGYSFRGVPLIRANVIVAK